jgi:hypothetical protein
MASADAEFWANGSDYEDIARIFEQNIERTHPAYVTSDRMTANLEYWCSWCATTVDYYEYRGPDVKHI